MILASCHVKTLVKDILICKTKSQMCRDFYVLSPLNIPAGNASAHALWALFSQNAHGGDEFALVVELVTGATPAMACLSGESITSYDPKTSRAERVSGSM